MRATAHKEDHQAMGAMLTDILRAGGDLAWVLIGSIEARAALNANLAREIRASCETALAVHARRTAPETISHPPSTLNTPSS